MPPIVNLADFAATPPQTETLIADTRRFLSIGLPAPSWNPDALANKKGGLRIYEEMEADEQVSACLALLIGALTGPGWDLQPSDPTSARAREFADLLKGDLLDVPGTLESKMEGMLSALTFGFSVSEPTWRVSPERVKLKDLKTRAPFSLDFKQDAFGNVTAVQQTQSGGVKDLDPSRFVILTWRGRFANVYGRSLLRPAYKPFFLKANVLAYWAAWLEQLSSPALVGKYPQGTQREKIDQMLKVLEHLQAKTAMAVPENFSVELLESNRDPKQVFESAVNRFDLMIARALLVPDRLGYGGGGETSGGSFALSQTHLGAFYFVLGSMGKWLTNAMQEQLIARMAHYESPNDPPPKFTLLPMSDEGKEAVATLWANAVERGVVISSNDDENWFRQLLGAPPAEERADRMKRELRPRARVQVPRGEDGDDEV